MDNNLNNYKNKNNHQKNSLQIGGSIILDNGWDINKFLKEIETQLISQKKNKRHSTIDNSIYNPESKNNYDTINSLTSCKKFSKNSRNDNSSYLNSMNSNSVYPLTGLNIIGKSKTNQKNSFHYPKIFTQTYSRKNIVSNSQDNHHMDSDEIFNVPKAVRNIKKAVEFARKERTKKRILLQSKLTFDENHLDTVFESDKLINNYKNHVQTSICSDNNMDLYSFINKNKQISKNNIFINLLKTEKSKIKKKLFIREKELENNQKIIEANENKFDEYKSVQKSANRQIENSLLSLRVPTIRLLELKRDIMADLKTTEDERAKLLEQIDDLRICAKFVCKVFGKNSILFREKIIDDEIENPNYEIITKNVLKRFDCFLTNNDKNNSDTLSEILNQPEVMIQKFNEIENGILRHLEIGNNTRDEIENIKNVGEESLVYIEKRCKELESDYQNLENDYKNSLNELNVLIRRKNNSNVDDEYSILIRDLFSGVMNTFKPKNSKFTGINVKQLKIEDCVKETQRILIENENKLYNLMFFIESIEKNNPKLFNEVIDLIKDVNKEKKLSMNKKNLEGMEKEKFAQNAFNSQKIIFIPRKTIPPFQPQKKARKVKIDPKVIERKENEELMTYE